MPDFTQYVPPGVYVEDTTQPTVLSTGDAGNALVLVGPGQGYRVAVEAVRAYAADEDTVPLSKRGVFTTAVVGPPAIAAPVVSNSAGVVLEVDTDYEWVVDTSAGGGADNAVTFLKRLPATTIARNVTNKELTSNVAILTTSVAHGFLVGASITVAGVDATFNGTYTTVAGTTGTTIRYALTHADITSTAATGTATGPATAAAPSPNGLAEGDSVSVTYRYADPLYYTPQMFDDYDYVVEAYGAALTTTPSINPNDSQVVSPLSLAAKVAFENGAGEVLCLATNPADGDTLQEQFQAAYSKLESDTRVGVMVPLFVDGYVTGLSTSDTATPSALQTYLTDLNAHLVGSAADGYGRTAVVGLVKDYDEATLSVADLAAWIGYKRTMLAYPTRVVMYNGSTNQNSEVDGIYLAAAMGARLLSNPVARGLTRQQILSFSGIPSSVFQTMTKTAKDAMSKAGVAVVEQDRGNRMVVRHGVTTDMTSMVTREISIVRVADRLLQLIQTGMENSNLIGQPITDDMPIRVKGALQGILEQARSSGVILEWINLKVRQQRTADAGDPTVIECKFSYRPAIPLNYITVSFSIDLDSGTLNTTEAV